MYGSPYNIELEQGAGYALLITIEAPPGTPRNLTDYTARLQVRDNHQDKTLLLSLDNVEGLKLGGDAGTPTNGQLKVEIPGRVAANFTWSSAIYDLFLNPGTDSAERLMYGTVTVAPRVTY
ncbi:hypothetical protein [Microbulbifer sp. PSTR4-B]|uniref:hypothetical protein n=1 Tax=unclassified Microbulbifer TaxID=2619833 RepID=UPI00403B0E4C